MGGLDVGLRKWEKNEEQKLEDATVSKAVAKYGAQKGSGAAAQLAQLVSWQVAKRRRNTN